MPGAHNNSLVLQRYTHRDLLGSLSPRPLCDHFTSNFGGLCRLISAQTVSLRCHPNQRYRGASTTAVSVEPVGPRQVNKHSQYQRVCGKPRTISLGTGRRDGSPVGTSGPSQKPRCDYTPVTSKDRDFAGRRAEPILGFRLDALCRFWSPQHMRSSDARKAKRQARVPTDEPGSRRAAQRQHFHHQANALLQRTSNDRSPGRTPHPTFGRRGDPARRQMTASVSRPCGGVNNAGPRPQPIPAGEHPMVKSNQPRTPGRGRSHDR